MKILFCGDSPTVETGFGVVAKNLLIRLQESGHQISVLGVNYYGDPYDHKEFPYPIFPVDKGSIEAMYGYRKLWGVEARVKPDLMFWLNDPWVIERYLQHKPEDSDRYYKNLAYYPVDAGPLKPEWARILTDEMDAQVCYSNFAERIVIEANGNKRPDNLHQVYHGVDTKTFFPINQSIARRRLKLPQDAFIVGMVARNQYRKRFDILMKGFAKFAQNKPEAKLYLHTGLQDVGFDIADLSRQFGLAEKLILTEGMDVSNPIPASMLNIIYNCFDVNALISLGDGFGLPVAESMATGCAQLVSNHSCLNELVDGHGGLTVKTDSWILNASGINTWGGVSNPDDIADKLEILYNNRDLRIKLAEDGYNYITQEQFTWDYVAARFNHIIKDIFHIVGGKYSGSEKHTGTTSTVSMGY